MSSSARFEFDIAVLGAGISGVVAAVRLLQLGYRVAIIERTDLTKVKAGESLVPECKHHFRKIGFEPEGSASIGYTGISSIWGSDEITRSDFIFNAYGNGLAIDRSDFERNLLQHGIRSGAVSFLNTEVTRLDRRDSGWKIRLSDRRTENAISARYLVIATGRCTRFRSLPSRRIFMDKLIAISSLVDWNSSVGERVLWIESLPMGWFYTNLLPNNRRILTFFTDADLISKSPGPAALFRKTVLRSVWSNENDFKLANSVGTFQVFDARTWWAQDQIGRGWIKLGDSAYSVDPLSGHGIKKNLEMIEFAVETIDSGLRNRDKTIQEYTRTNTANFVRHLKRGRDVYSEEQRWTTSRFWRRRSPSAEVYENRMIQV